MNSSRAEAPERLAASVRVATIQDAERLAQLSTQLGYPSSREDVERRLELIERTPDHVVYVAALADGSVVGWLHAYVRRLVESDTSAELGGLVVDEHCRGRGVGRVLMDHAEQWARGKGCTALSLRSNIIRDGAHKFYQDLGYAVLKTQYAFWKKL